MDQGAPLGSTPIRPLNGAAIPRGPHLLLEPLPAETDDDYDALRDLFLSGSPLAPAASVPPARPAPMPSIAPSSRPDREPVSATTVALVEGLILGHLPVYGPAWIGQYAWSLADEVGGPVGLIRVRTGQASLDVYGEAPTDLNECGTLDEAIAAAAPVVARWLIRLDEMDEPKMAESPRLGRITLMTGVDETAMVACYGTLKRLVRQDEDGDPVGPTVRLAIMGASPERAGPAAEKLARAAETFLGRSVEAAACLSKISPGRSVSLFRGPTDAGLDQILDLIASAPRRALKLSVSRGVPAPAEPAPAIATPPRIANPVPAPATVQPPTPAHPTPDASPGVSLCSRIGGLQPLAARCPHAPAVELACDSSGVLHLIAQAEESAGNSTAEERALASLTTCGAWATAHLTLISLTAPESHLLTSGAKPVLHLTTRSAPAVRRLLDADVRIHLLATAEIDGRSATVCVALN